MAAEARRVKEMWKEVSHCYLFSGENLYIIDNNRYQEEDDTYAELQQINKIVSMRKWSKNDQT